MNLFYEKDIVRLFDFLTPSIDAVVNAGNPQMYFGGGGTNKIFSDILGEKRWFQLHQQYKIKELRAGDVIFFNLAKINFISKKLGNAKYFIEAIAPDIAIIDKQRALQIIKTMTKKLLDLANKYKIKTLLLPLIGTGIYARNDIPYKNKVVKIQMDILRKYSSQYLKNIIIVSKDDELIKPYEKYFVSIPKFSEKFIPPTIKRDGLLPRLIEHNDYLWKGWYTPSYYSPNNMFETIKPNKNIHNIIDLIAWAKKHKLLYHLKQFNTKDEASQMNPIADQFCMIIKSKKYCGPFRGPIGYDYWKKIKSYEQMLKATIKMYDYMYLEFLPEFSYYDWMILKKYLLKILKCGFMVYGCQSGSLFEYNKIRRPLLTFDLIYDNKMYDIKLPMIEIGAPKHKIDQLMTQLSKINKKYSDLFMIYKLDYEIVNQYYQDCLQEGSFCPDPLFVEYTIDNLSISEQLMNEVKNHMIIRLISAPKYWFENELFFENLYKASCIVDAI